MGVEDGVLVGVECPPPLDRLLPGSALGCPRPTFEIRERRVIRRDQPRLRTPLDRHVAHRHPAFHRQRPDRFPGVLDDVADPPSGAELADRAEDHVLGGDPWRARAHELDLHRLRTQLGKRLGREHVLHLGRADPESERAERAMRRGVRVAADDRHAGLGQSQLGPDHVHDALAARTRAVELDAKCVAVRLQRLELQPCHLVLDRPLGGRDVVIHRRDGEVGPAHGPSRQPKAFEGLWRRDLVHQVEVDVEQRRALGLLAHDVRVPDLLEERLRHPFDSTESVPGDRRDR